MSDVGKSLPFYELAWVRTGGGRADKLNGYWVEWKHLKTGERGFLPNIIHPEQAIAPKYWKLEL